MGGEEVYSARREQEPEPAFDAIIPAPVRYNDALRPNAKLMYGEIRALCRSRGYCWASNAYFAKLYGMNERSIARFIAQLEELKLIQVVIMRDENGRVCGRRIYIVFPFECEENDTSNHMTKKSATCPKSQGEGDQNVSQSLNNNINNNKYARAKKSAEIAVVKAELKAWVDSLNLKAQDADALMSRLSDFADLRREKGSPMSTGRCITILCNRLQRYSNGNVAVMTAMLDKAIFRRWEEVYQLREDELREVLGNGTPASAADSEEDAPWV